MATINTNRSTRKRRHSRLKSLESLLSLNRARPSMAESTRSQTSNNSQRIGITKTLVRKASRMLQRLGGRPEVTKTVASSSSASTRPSTSEMPLHIQAFVEALTVTKLSNFLIWMLYHDVVALPNDPVAWYRPVDSMEMRGWVDFGTYLSASNRNTAYGHELVVLEDIIIRMDLIRNTVLDLVKKVSTPESMQYSTIATTKQQAHQESLSSLKELEAVQTQLFKLKTLASRMKPEPGSQFDEWHAITQIRLCDFMNLIIGPRIKACKLGEHFDFREDDQEGRELDYLYQAIQQPRVVPLSHYPDHPGSAGQADVATSMTSPLDGDEESEHAGNHQNHLMAENRKLHAKIARLEQEIQRLNDQVDHVRQERDGYKASNVILARRNNARGSRGQPQAYLNNTSPSIRSATEELVPETPARYHPRPRSIGPRSIIASGSTIPALSTPLSSATRTWRGDLTVRDTPRGHEDVFSNTQGSSLPSRAPGSSATNTFYGGNRISTGTPRNYEDVFSSIQGSSLPSLRLSDPAARGAGEAREGSEDDKDDVEGKHVIRVPGK